MQTPNVQTHPIPANTDEPHLVSNDGLSGEISGLYGHEMPLNRFLADFGDSLFTAVTEQNKPVYRGQVYPDTEAVLDGLFRRLFTAQREVVRAVFQLLVREDKPAAVINAEMGTGKTMMSIAVAAAAHRAGLHRTLVLSPPHLVYKWRREILNTVPDARPPQ